MASAKPASTTTVPSKRKMRPGAGKSKGNGFESTVAKKLTAALQPLNFMRTPGSGARVGGKNFATMGQLMGEDALKIFVGDVVCLNERATGLVFQHSIECKFYATQDNFVSLASGNANVFKWFKEAADDAQKLSKEPLLIFKWNHTPIFAAVDGATSKRTQHLEAAGIRPSFTVMRYGADGADVVLDVYELDTLLTVPSFWYEQPAT
jgi:hypothetical protein